MWATPGAKIIGIQVHFERRGSWFGQWTLITSRTSEWTPNSETQILTYRCLNLHFFWYFSELSPPSLHLNLKKMIFTSCPNLRLQLFIHSWIFSNFIETKDFFPYPRGVHLKLRLGITWVSTFDPLMYVLQNHLKFVKQLWSC